MSWRVAFSIPVLLRQLDKLYPTRSKRSDGTIGDTAHQHQGRASDHNPWVRGPGGIGIVTAVDITHDPSNGCDIKQLFDRIAASRDPRVKYMIFDKRIMSGSQGPSPWKWRAYGGSNPHQKHGHLSVKPLALFYDDTSNWAIYPKTGPVAVMEEEMNPSGTIPVGTTEWCIGVDLYGTWKRSGSGAWIAMGGDLLTHVRVAVHRGRGKGWDILDRLIEPDNSLDDCTVHVVGECSKVTLQFPEPIGHSIAYVVRYE